MRILATCGLSTWAKSGLVPTTSGTAASDSLVGPLRTTERSAMTTTPTRGARLPTMQTHVAEGHVEGALERSRASGGLRE